MRERRKLYANDPAQILAILKDGTQRANALPKIHWPKLKKR